MKLLPPEKISECQAASSECHYRCCDQSLPQDPDYDPENSLLLYPGEWKKIQMPKGHIVITDDDFYGGKRGYCDRSRFDQSACNPAKNAKLLDCESYPFFPTIQNGRLELMIDSERCPLSRHTERMRAHYELIFNKWEAVLAGNEAVREWIRRIELPSYSLFRP